MNLTLLLSSFSMLGVAGFGLSNYHVFIGLSFLVFSAKNQDEDEPKLVKLKNCECFMALHMPQKLAVIFG
jgi:hypothetical protein